MSEGTFFPVLYLINDHNSGDSLSNRIKVADTPEDLPSNTPIIILKTNFKPVENWLEYVNLGIYLEFKYGE